MMYRRTLVIGVLCALVTAVSAQPTAAPEEKKPPVDLKGAKPSATVELESEQVRLIMGGSAGKGVLRFDGKDYPFTFKTASAGLGAKVVTKVSATGNVYFLNKVEDFAGRYVVQTKAAYVGSGSAAADYQNDKGVFVSLRGKTEGVGLSFGAGIATIELVKQ